MGTSATPQSGPEPLTRSRPRCSLPGANQAGVACASHLVHDLVVVTLFFVTVVLVLVLVFLGFLAVRDRGIRRRRSPGAHGAPLGPGRHVSVLTAPAHLPRARPTPRTHPHRPRGRETTKDLGAESATTLGPLPDSTAVMPRSQVQPGVLSWPLLPPSAFRYSLPSPLSPSRSGSTHLGGVSPGPVPRRMRELQLCVTGVPQPGAALVVAGGPARAVARAAQATWCETSLAPAHRSRSLSASRLGSRDTVALSDFPEPGAWLATAPAPRPFGPHLPGEVGVAADVGTKTQRPAALGSA